MRESLSKIETELDKKTRQLNLANARLATLLDEVKAKKLEAEQLNQLVSVRRGLLQQRAAALYRWQRARQTAGDLEQRHVSLSQFMRRQHYLQAAISFDRDLVAQLEDESARLAVVQDQSAKKRRARRAKSRPSDWPKEAVRQEAEKKKLLLASLGREKESRLRALNKWKRRRSDCKR